jgi:UDP-N-acetylmuramoylalanine--D-glutamate ligase
MGMEFFGKRALVVGAGKSGVSAARFLAGRGALVTISEIEPEAHLNQECLKEMLGLGIKLETEGHRTETFLSADNIIISPGVPLDIGPLVAAREKGISVVGEMELAGRLIDIPIIAVTGTNGKSTATALLGSIMNNAGLKTFVGGNIGTPLMDYVAEDWKADCAVVEVSSFQLDTMERFRPKISLLLNISPDHMDRYPDYGAYVQSKMKIFKNQGSGDYAILNDEDKRIPPFEPSGEVTVLRYGAEAGRNRQAFIEHQKMRASLPGAGTHYLDLDTFRLPGRHNVENLMGVVLASLAFGVEPHIVQEVIDHFEGLPDRLEWIRSIRGVDFYNDSKATNVASAARSIASFDRPMILIAGGRHKGGDYAPLVKAASGRVRKAVFLGEAKYLLAKSFKGTLPFELSENLESAVFQAFTWAAPGEVVLLAPACSSFDMFSDYAHRGAVFRKAVMRLVNGR